MEDYQKAESYVDLALAYDDRSPKALQAKEFLKERMEK
jgi:hypothetical protein